MRNPWAVELYKGPYRDSDPIWNQADYAEQVGLKKGNDGIFFMDVKSFKAGFDILQLSHFHQGKWNHAQ